MPRTPQPTNIGDVAGYGEPAEPGRHDVIETERTSRPSIRPGDERPELPPQGRETRIPGLAITAQERDMTGPDALVFSGEHGVIRSRRIDHDDSSQLPQDIYAERPLRRRPPDAADSDMYTE